MSRALVAGFGSIGRRHAAILAGLGCEVAVLSRRPVEGTAGYQSLPEAVAQFRPDYVVIATETSAHRGQLAELADLGFAGMVLVEKPLDVAPGPLPAHRFRAVRLAYNLRFHPVLMALKEHLSGQRAISAQIYCGQHLPDWRPGTDYRQSYSADPARGGGVLRDLSHELDLARWLFGDWSRMAALGGRLGPLEIASDDCWGLLMEAQSCPVLTVQINYLDRPGRRDIVVNTADHTYCVQLGSGMLIVDGEIHEFSVARDDTYRAQHLAMLEGRHALLCSLEEGETIMRTIASAESAAQSGQWVVS